MKQVKLDLSFVKTDLADAKFELMIVNPKFLLRKMILLVMKIKL